MLMRHESDQVPGSRKRTCVIFHQRSNISFVRNELIIDRVRPCSLSSSMFWTPTLELGHDLRQGVYLLCMHLADCLRLLSTVQHCESTIPENIRRTYLCPSSMPEIVMVESCEEGLMQLLC